MHEENLCYSSTNAVKQNAGASRLCHASLLQLMDRRWLYGSNSIFEVAARYVKCSDQTRLESSISYRRMEVTGHWRLLSRWV